MNKHLPNSLRALFLSLAVLLSLPMLALKVEIDGIRYELVLTNATVIAKSSGKYSGEVVIPESVEHYGSTYSVTSIGESAFSGCSGLTSVTIPNSVTSIGRSAFSGCSGLTSVTIPNSVTSIGESAFFHCYGLTSVVVEDGNPVYDSRNNCNAIIEIATNTLHSGFKTTIIPNSVTSIRSGAFRDCSGLTSVTIPNSVTSIGREAFRGCSGLTSVTIGNSVTGIGDGAFYGCKGLTSVTIGNSVKSIGESAFSGCKGLTSVTIPNSVTSIGERVFYGCSGLTSVTIPNSVTSIGRFAFLVCSGLTSVTIPNSVTSIGIWAFAGCPKLLDFYCYAEKVPSTHSDAFDDSYPENATLHVPAASIDSYKATYPWSEFGKIVALPGQYSLTVSTVGYATLYLDFNAEIPEGVEAYVAKEVVDSRLKMERVEGVLPANTGVIIMAEEGTYAFVESNETPAVIEKNLLKGTVEKTEITAEANTSYYVLSAPDGVVAMYLAKLTENKFWNNANRAYLPINYGDQLSRKFVFDFGDETGIAETENGNVKAENSAIFDLSGRRVQKGQKGIFIRDGKVVVK